MLAKKGAIFQMSGMANFINKNTLKSSLLFPLGHKRREELMWNKVGTCENKRYIYKFVFVSWRKIFRKKVR